MWNGSGRIAVEGFMKNTSPIRKYYAIFNTPASSQGYCFSEIVDFRVKVQNGRCSYYVHRVILPTILGSQTISGSNASV
jgi:hypothetical protein